MEYATALSFDSGDRLLWRRIARLSAILRLNRVTRFALEAEIDNEGQEWLQTGLLWDIGTTIHQRIAKSKWKDIVVQLQDKYTLDQLSVENDDDQNFQASILEIDGDLQWLSENSSSGSVTGLSKPSVQVLTVRPVACSWYALARALVEKHRVSSNNRTQAPVHFIIEVLDLDARTTIPSEIEMSDDDFSEAELESRDAADPDRKHDQDSQDTPMELITERGKVKTNSEQLILGELDRPTEVDDNIVREDVKFDGKDTDSESSVSSDQASSVATDEQEHSDADSSAAHSDHNKLHSDSLLLVTQSEIPAEDGLARQELLEQISDADQDDEEEEEEDAEDEEEGEERNIDEDETNQQDEAEDITGLMNIGLESQSPAPSRSMSPSITRKRAQDPDSGDEDAITRVSKRVKQRALYTTSSEASSFHIVLLELFEPLGIDLLPLVDLDPEPPSDIEADTPAPSIYNDLKSLLYFDWSDERARAAKYMPKATNSSFSRTMMLSYPPLLCPKKDVECDRSQLVEFAASIEAGNSYYRNVNTALLLALLGTDLQKRSSPYIDHAWSTNFRTIIVRLVSTEESVLVNRVEQILGEESTRAESDTDLLLNTLTWSQALFELCLDDLVVSEKSRLESSSSADQDRSLVDRACRWQSITSDLVDNMRKIMGKHGILSIRNRWASILLAQVMGSPVEDTIKAYKILLQLMSGDECAANEMVLPNCQTINKISTKALELEISKFSTMDFFNEVFDSTRSMDHKSVLAHLEPVLMKRDHYSSSMALIEDYLSRSPHEFRLQLWSMLSKAFESVGNAGDAISCWTTSLRLLIEMILPDVEQDIPLIRRQEALLRVLEQASAHIKDIAIAMEHDGTVIDDWAQDRCLEALQAMFLYLPLLYVFAFYEDGASEDKTYLRSTLGFIQFRDRTRIDLVRSWIIIYHVFKQYEAARVSELDNNGHKLARLINIVHDDLGTRGYCSLLNGSILDLFEEEIFRLDMAETELDLVQVFHCRYGISYQVGSQVPWDHYAKEITLSVDRAMRITPFVLTFVQERSPGVWLPKADVKIALEKLHKVISPCLDDMRVVVRNKSIVDAYTSHEIVPRDFKNCLLGYLSIEAKDTTSPGDISIKQWNAASTLNLTLARIYLSTHRSRKSNTKGVQDLEDAQRYFQLDLYLNPSRVESWQALAYINSALADKELSYDAQRIWDHRSDISKLQRVMVLCYMMATSLSVQERQISVTRSENADVAFADLLYEFGSQIYSSARAPLEMECFARTELKYMERGADRPEMESLPSVTLNEALQVASRCLYRASKDCTEKWRCNLFLGKTHEKLRLRPSVSLNDYRTATTLAPSHSTIENGPLLDPHYKLVSSVYKYLAAGSIEPVLALEYLKSTPYATSHLDISDITKENVVKVIHATLTEMCDADKKHWHHRPVHRLARLAYDRPSYTPGFTDQTVATSAARSRIESLFTAKGSASNLLSIWRPEFERAGRHYHYANRYTNFYIDLLLEQQDMESLRNIMRRLRKGTQNVLNHKDTWDRLCSSYIALSISKNDVPQADTSPFVDIMDSVTFNTGASRLELATTLPTFYPAALRVLRDFYDLRKLNGGLYDTNKIDDAIMNCYIVLYSNVQSMSDMQLGIPAPEPSIPAQVSTIQTMDGSQLLQSTMDGFVQPLNPDINPTNGITSGQGTTTTGELQVPTTPIAKPKGRPKEPKIIKISRRDILSKSFALCKPKGIVPFEGRQRSDSTRSRTKVDSPSEETVSREDLSHLDKDSAVGGGGAEQTTTSMLSMDCDVDERTRQKDQHPTTAQVSSSEHTSNQKEL